MIQICACMVCVLFGEYVCLQKELESIPMGSGSSADAERDRERRAANASVNGIDDNAQAERSSLISEETRGERGVQTTTIRLNPNNIFNV